MNALKKMKSLWQRLLPHMQQSSCNEHSDKNPKRSPVPPSVWQNPIHFIACGFGSGALPWVPGTWGSVVGVLFFLFLTPLSLPFYLLSLTILTVLGVWASEITARDFGIHDHTSVNFDEIIGYLVTMIAIPATPFWIISGFILFRLFDIWKPWPIRLADEKIHGGFGMIFDDILAGALACALLQLVLLVR